MVSVRRILKSAGRKLLANLLADDELLEDDEDDELLEDDEASPAEDDDAPLEPEQEEEEKVHECLYCGQSWKMSEAVSLTRMCEHGLTTTPRLFAETARVQTLPDSRTSIVLDLSDQGAQSQAVIVISNGDAERLRVQLGKPGASAVVERWRTP